MSLDGYAAGPDQSLDHPVGVGGGPLHDWVRATRTFRQTFGGEGGGEGLDDMFAARGDDGIGATIMGRNMFGPIRGPWGDENWRGWWGEDPQLFDRRDGGPVGYECVEFVASSAVMHVRFARKARH
jgi:dihydrofolate reductase